MGTLTTTRRAGGGAARRRDDRALVAYEEIAGVYDAFTAGHDYERFLAVIERLASELGLAGRDALDVACGTGKSFMPLLRRGYRVTACDLSPAMVTRARRKCAERAEVLVADMRELPELGRFDLVTCLDDSLNYLLTDGELAAAFRGIANSLRSGGVAVFDVNSLKTYRSAFADTLVLDQDGILFCWRGETSPEIGEGEQAVATLEAFTPRAGGGWTRLCSRHVQRHHPRTTVARLCREGGLDLVSVWGQDPGARLDPDPAEERHTKLLYFARRKGCSVS
jgi:SAM-dependent methyltransferase